ncbi:PB1 domain-containing protein [Forsythia ovata]|uniref:PB1 domain-containing protein n=1 Tax=Forsythia ovata TaxID=205694 RepID=A0ABD1VJ03_9LAMI
MSKSFEYNKTLDPINSPSIHEKLRCPLSTKPPKVKWARLKEIQSDLFLKTTLGCPLVWQWILSHIATSPFLMAPIFATCVPLPFLDILPLVLGKGMYKCLIAFKHMMHEYDRLYRVFPKPSRLRIFIFHNLNPSSNSSVRIFGSDDAKSENERFMKALNFGLVMTAQPPVDATVVSPQSPPANNNVD